MIDIIFMLFSSLTHWIYTDKQRKKCIFFHRKTIQNFVSLIVDLHTELNERSWINMLIK